MVTIIHAADLHLDSPFSGLTPQQAARRRGEQRRLLQDLVELCRSRGADALLLAGDILDGGRVYRETAQVLARELRELSCPVFISPGNHDPYTPDSLYAALEWPENVHIFGENVEKISIPEKNFAVYGFGFSQSRCQSSPLEGFRVEGPERVNLMCLHADLSPDSPYCPLTREQVANSGLTYLALGHIHQCSGVQREGNTFWAYPGCPQGRGFDECGEKGVLALSIAPGQVQGEFIPLARRRYERLTVDVTGREPLDAVRAALPPDTGDHTYRITLTGECEGVELQALERALAPRFDGLRLKDATRLPGRLWTRRGEDNLTGAYLDRLWQLCQSDPNNEIYALAARFALAALEGGEDPAP